MLEISDWNKLSSKERRRIKNSHDLVFITGPMSMSRKRIKEVVADLKGKSILFGCLKDEEIPGLEGSPQFLPLRIEDLEKSLGRNSKVTILKHFHKDLKYIIRELIPSKVIFVNGSWEGPIHYRTEYWKALDMGAKIEIVSPFSSEREAISYEKAICAKLSTSALYKKTKKYSEKELMRLAQDISKYSWDWIGQIGAVFARKGKVLAVAWNRVVPYQSYQMHFGSPREAKQIPSQEMLETQLTNHAECELLEIARRRKINLKGSSLYINMFPCPVCAKILSRTDIERIVYSQDHNVANDIGYKVLAKSKKKMKRVVI